MFSGVGKRVVAIIAAASMLCGCAEFDRRGGVIAEIGDYVLFQAHTKSHRLFRSYILIGVLTAAARQAGHTEADKAGIGGGLKAALSVAFEAYECLYQDQFEKGKPPQWIHFASNPRSVVGTYEALKFGDPAICQFFDEKMARLDYALYRLALAALFNEKTSVQLATIRDKLIGEIPVVSASAKATIFAAKAVSQATNIVDDLLSLSFSSLGPTLILLPLYRDALEMNMWVILDTLTRSCAAQDPTKALVVDPGAPAKIALDCATNAYAAYILNKGNGNLSEWRAFVRAMNEVGYSIEAYAPHFVLVSRLIWRSCINLLTQDECRDILEKAGEAASDQSLRVKVSYDDKGNISRYYSASVRLRSRVARRSPPSQQQVPARDSEPTGSINQPKPPAAPAAPAR